MGVIEPAALPSLVTLPNVDILATGTWALSTGEATFTTEDLANAVQAAQCPAVGAPVLKLGHVDPRFDGEPAVGRVLNLGLTAAGNKLTGDLAGLPAWLGVAMASAYPNRSIEGYYDFACQMGHVHPFAIKALALLGVTPPGVGVLSSLADVAALYGVAASDNGGTGRPWKTLGEAMPKGVQAAAPVLAAGITTEDVRRAYYDQDATPMSYWITELQLAPDPQLIVCDESSAKIYRVPIVIDGTDVTFGDPVEVEVEYQDVPAEGAKTAAATRWGSPVAARAGLERPATTAAAAHGSFNGEHSHSHAAMGAQGDDAMHEHAHTHTGDAAHGHHSAATASANLNPTSDPKAREARAMQIELTDAEAAELRTQLGKAEDAELTGPEVLAALKDREAKAQDAESKVSAAAAADKGMVRVDAAQWTQMQQDVKAGQEARTEQRRQHRDSLISAAITDGKFPPARREHWQKLYDADPEGTEQTIATLAAGLVPLKDIGQGGGEPGGDRDPEYEALFGEDK